MFSVKTLLQNPTKSFLQQQQMRQIETYVINRGRGAPTSSASLPPATVATCVSLEGAPASFHGARVTYSESMPDPDSPLSPDFNQSRVSSVSEVSSLASFCLLVQGRLSGVCKYISWQTLSRLSLNQTYCTGRPSQCSLLCFPHVLVACNKHSKAGRDKNKIYF